MSRNTEPDELPKRPEKPKIFGKLADTIIMMGGQKVSQTYVEHIGNGIYEVQFFVYDRGLNDPETKRTEYVLHLNKIELRLLGGLIREALG